MYPFVLDNEVGNVGWNLVIARNTCLNSLLDFGQKEKIVSVIITLTKSGNVPLSPVNLITEK